MSSHSYSSEQLILKIARTTQQQTFKTAFANAILQEALRRNNIHYQSIYVPSKRSLSWSNSGKVDGELMRVKNIAQLSPANTQNLVRIEQPIIEIQLAAFTNKNITLSGWSSLRGYRVHYLRGRKAFEKKLSSVASSSDINTTNDLAQAMRILTSGRTDIVLADVFSATQLINATPAFKEIKIGTVLQTIKLYSFLNHKHSHLVAPITTTLKEMMADKSYFKIQQLLLNAHIAPDK